MRDVVPSEAVEAYLELALAGEQQRATSYVLSLLHPATSTQLIRDVLAPAQREVGERWHRGELTAAEEHLVTAVTESTLAALASALVRLEPRGLVLVTCAEDDWHALASRMFAELLRDAGREVLYLGPSAPAADVAAFIERRRPEAVTVTCNLASSYLGTTRIVDAAHAHGVPVLAGGRALDLQRALALGADGWACDAANATRVLDQWRRRTPVVDPRPVEHQWGPLELASRAAETGVRTYEELVQQRASLCGLQRRWPTTLRTDLIEAVRSVAAARLVDDPTVFGAHWEWLRQLYAAREVPEQVLEAGVHALRPLVGAIDVEAADLLVGR